MSPKHIFAIIIVLIIGYAALDSAFIVDERERVVVVELGEIVGQNYEPGLHFKVPFILSSSNLILAEQSEGGPLMYLPLEKMLNDARRNKQAEAAANNGMNNGSSGDGASSGSSTYDGSSSGSSSSSNSASDNLRSRDRNS